MNYNIINGWGPAPLPRGTPTDESLNSQNVGVNPITLNGSGDSSNAGGIVSSDTTNDAKSRTASGFKQLDPAEFGADYSLKRAAPHEVAVYENPNVPIRRKLNPPSLPKKHTLAQHVQTTLAGM